MSNPSLQKVPKPKGDISALVIDMDGVLWRGSQPLPGLVQFFELIH